MNIKLILGPVPNNPIIDSIQSGNIRSIQFPIYRSIRSPAAAAAMLNKIGVCTVVRAPCYCNDNNEPCFPIPHGSDVAALIIAGLRALLSVLLHGRFSVASLHACYTIVLGNSSQISTASRNSTCVFLFLLHPFIHRLLLMVFISPRNHFQCATPLPSFAWFVRSSSLHARSKDAMWAPICAAKWW